MVIRSCVKPVQMFEMIALTGYLGTLDVNEFGEQVRESEFPHTIRTIKLARQLSCMGFGSRTGWGRTGR